MLIEKKWKAPRVWSNIELKKVSHLFSGYNTPRKLNNFL